MKESFIGESIVPVKESIEAISSAPGEPCVPKAFSWKGGTIEIAAVLERWKEAGDCHHGSGERYIRKHWYRVRTSQGVEMRIYLERQPRGRSRSRWRLYTVQCAPEPR